VVVGSRYLSTSVETKVLKLWQADGTVVMAKLSKVTKVLGQRRFYTKKGDFWGVTTSQPSDKELI
jgi:hypothetical protein